MWSSSLSSSLVVINCRTTLVRGFLCLFEYALDAVGHAGERGTIVLFQRWASVVRADEDWYPKRRFLPQCLSNGWSPHGPSSAPDSTA